MDFKKLRSIRVPSSLLMRRTQERPKPVADKPDRAANTPHTIVPETAPPSDMSSGPLLTVKPRTPKTPLGASKPSAPPRIELAETPVQPVVVAEPSAPSSVAPAPQLPIPPSPDLPLDVAATEAVEPEPEEEAPAPEPSPQPAPEPAAPEAEPEPKPEPKPQSKPKPAPTPKVEPVARPAAKPQSSELAEPSTPVKPARTHRSRRRLHIPSLPHPHWRNFWLFVWIILAIGAAQATLYIRPLVGVYVDAAAFASLLWLALRLERARQLVISAAIIPLLMLVSLCLPQATVFIRTADLSLLMLVLALVYRYLFALDYPVDGTRLRMTRHGYLFAIPLMVVFGQFLGLIGFGLLHHQYDFRDSTLPLVALGSVVFAIAEESLFRGLIQQRAMLLFNPKLGTALSAALYAGLMFGHRGGLWSPFFGALLGTALAIVYYKKQNLLLTITINAATKLTYVGLVAIFVLRH